uniref:RING-type domain-containing protein n=1 Tax=Plectus sambesii TaxID=2011161 RepID=A0A914X800_9BILA
MDLFKLFENTGMCPWIMIARHSSALLVYGIAFAQWPTTNSLDETFNSSTTTFTLALWTACFYHYVVSAGRVVIDWERYRFKAKGWLVKSSRRMHRAIMVLALTVCSATIIQPATVYSMRATHLESSAAQSRTAALLKVDFLFALMLTSYIGIRLYLEPTGLIKRRRRRRQNDDDGQIADPAELAETEPTAESAPEPPPLVLPSYSKHPSDPEECSICVERVANRQTNCGHRLCSVCLRDLAGSADRATGVKCPFCRRSLTSAKRLLVIAEADNVPLNHDSDSEEEEQTPARRQKMAAIVPV